MGTIEIPLYMFSDEELQGHIETCDFMNSEIEKGDLTGELDEMSPLRDKLQAELDYRRNAVFSLTADKRIVQRKKH